MLLIASILGVIGAALFQRRTPTALRLRSLKERLFGTASAKALMQTENRR